MLSTSSKGCHTEERVSVFLVKQYDHWVKLWAGNFWLKRTKKERDSVMKQREKP